TPSPTRWPPSGRRPRPTRTSSGRHPTGRWFAGSTRRARPGAPTSAGLWPGVSSPREVSAPSPSPGDGDGGVAGPPPPPDDRIAGLEHGRGRGPLADRRPGAGPAHLALLPVAAARPVRRPVPVPGGAGPPGNPPG